MRRIALSVCLFMSVAAVVFAQASESGEGPASDSLGPWKIANTLIFAVLLGYFIYKKAPAFFNARSADIQKAIQDATGLEMNADLRYSEMDRKMATLSQEVQRLRDESAAEMEREQRRRQQETEEGIRRIQASANAQIQAFRQAAVRSLQGYAADNALDLAARRITEQAPGSVSEDAIQEFTSLVQRGRN